MKPVIFLAFANDKVDNTRYLRNLPLELDGIRKALQPAVKEGLCEVIERANVTLEQIFDIFQTYKDRIAIFHYGGHADGYQLLLETLTVVENPISGSGNSVAHGEGLVSFFARQKGLQLVFFNGCSTQQQALELGKAGIPAVIGTSNAINDDIATTLSVRFYAGLGKGGGIEKAWLEATDEIKTREGTANLRGLYRKSDAEVSNDRFPWEVYFRTGAEKVKEWNLPEEADNPLFGLPNIPISFALPESPFLFLKRYERPHAEVFFGRSFYVRDLYNKITDAQSPPVIMLYGQSGTGKSSLFDAGLNPRLENSHFVIYLRREQDLGLVGTLKGALVDWYEKLSSVENISLADIQTTADEEVIKSEQLAKAQTTARQQILESLKSQLLTLAESEKISLAATIESLERELLPVKNDTYYEIKRFNEQNFLAQLSNIPYAEILIFWHKLEAITQKPIVIILDQAEELFTRPSKQFPHELEDFAQCLRSIFNNPALAPLGKIVLGYRKEYHAEFEERFKEHAIPRSKTFLEPLSRKDILDIFRGLTETPRLHQRYNLQIDKNLAVIIADDLLEDKESPIAPVLQILLTKMWDKVRETPKPTFTVKLYQDLKYDGFLLDDFFRQQTKKLAEWNKELESSGLPLDILQFHTTHLGTAGSKSFEEIKKHYAHIPEKTELLLYKLKELYLLVEAGEHRTNLTHDTLAPLVKNEYRKSERAGQRASRILENQSNDFLLNNECVLDDLEVEVVEKGKEGMRIWGDNEREFVQASQTACMEREHAKKRRRQYAIAAVSTILITALFSIYQWNKSIKHADSAKMKELMLLSSQKINSQRPEEKDLAVRLAEQASFFGENAENKDKVEIFDNFRKVSEDYRSRHSEGKSWLPPFQEIRYRESPYKVEFMQQKMSDPAFMTLRRNSMEFGKAQENAPEFPISGENYYDIALKNTLDNQNLVIWIKNHSFRICPYRHSEQTKIIRADSLIVDFFPVDSTLWFVRDAKDSLKMLNPQSVQTKALLKLQSDSSGNQHTVQFIKYKKPYLYLWNFYHLLRINPSRQPVAVDTLFSVSPELFAQTTDYGRSAQDFVPISVAFSPDANIGIIYSSEKAIYITKSERESTYTTLPIQKWKNIPINTRAFSPSLSHLLVRSGTQSFVFYKLQIERERVVLNEVFNKTINAVKNPIGEISISQDNTNHLFIKLFNQVRIYDSEGKLKDILFFNQEESLAFGFSDGGRYIINTQKDKISLYLPIYAMSEWLKQTGIETIDISTKIAYDIASLQERWQSYESRKLILAQFVSFATILLILIRYTPVAIQLYKEKRYYKIVMYSLAALTFFATTIYREIYTEIDENIINKLADNFIILSLFYIGVIFFEQRQEIAAIVKAKKWYSLALYTMPELLVFCACVYGTYSILSHTDELSYYFIIPFYILNVVVLWTLHLSEKSFKEKKYVKTLGLLYFPFNYLAWFLNQYATPDNDVIFWLAAVIYLLLWLGIWAVKGIYDWWVRKRKKKQLSLSLFLIKKTNFDVK